MVNIFTPIPKTLAFGAEFHCGSSYGISKAGDGYKGLAPPNFTSFW